MWRTCRLWALEKAKGAAIGTLIFCFACTMQVLEGAKHQTCERNPSAHNSCIVGGVLQKICRPPTFKVFDLLLSDKFPEEGFGSRDENTDAGGSVDLVLVHWLATAHQ